MLKRFFRSNAFINTVTWLIAGYFRFVYATSRFTWVYDPDEGDLIGAGEPLIFSFYHGRLAMMPFVKPPSYYSGMLISRHGEGSMGWPISGSSTGAGRVRPIRLRKSCCALVPASMAMWTVPMLLE